MLPRLCPVYCAPLTVMVVLTARDLESGYNALYDGGVLAAVGDMVVVVPNFRLGVFGFLNAKSTAAPGNVALLDQRLALHWVRDNIEAFGGNNTQVDQLSGTASLTQPLLPTQIPFGRQHDFQPVLSTLRN